MNGIILLVVVAAVAAVLIIKKSGQVPVPDALKHLQNGALVIDVRSPGEFNSGHLTRAINLPLDTIETALPEQVKDKDRVLLLHCASGLRSGVARQKLKKLGYANAFNLGSYGRAECVLRQAN